MRLIILVITFLLIDCKTNRFDSNHFNHLIDNENVTIYLSDYKLNGVPNEIARLTKARRLYISVDKGGWTVYPPLSVLPQPQTNLLSSRLPDEITELKNLKSLALVRLNLKKLPADFGKLESLDSLDLSLNNLFISHELPKLKKLKNLRYLNILGNVADSNDIVELKKNNDNINIIMTME